MRIQVGDTVRRIKGEEEYLNIGEEVIVTELGKDKNLKCNKSSYWFKADYFQFVSRPFDPFDLTDDEVNNYLKPICAENIFEEKETKIIDNYLIY